MMRSASAILTTHGGGLPAPPDLAAHLRARPDRSPDDAVLARAVHVTVRRQVECGIDIVGDGDLSRLDHSRWLRDRLTGFDGVGRFPSVDGSSETSALEVPVCTGAVSYHGRAHVERDISNLVFALRDVSAREAFLACDSPGLLALLHENRHYESYTAYVTALADALHEEYSAIHRAGLVLRVDCSDLALLGRVGTGSLDDAALRERAELHVTALNHALRAIPPTRVRLSVSWGNYAGPHERDVPLSELVPLLLRARPAGIGFAAANPRHSHEWSVWGELPLTHGKLLIPGVIDTTSPYVEHPALVCERILRFAHIVGGQGVVAGTDSGFRGFGPFSGLDSEIVWHKLAALAEGATMASAELAPVRRKSTTPVVHR